MRTIDTEAAKALHAKSPGVARTLAAEIRNALVPLNISAYENSDSDAQESVDRLSRIAHALFNGEFAVGDVVRFSVFFQFAGTHGIVVELSERGTIICESAGQRVEVQPHYIEKLREPT